MNALDALVRWLTDPASWQGSGGIPQRALEHLLFSLGVVAVAAALAVPLGLWIGHTGRGRLAVVGVVNTMRAMPTLGLLFAAILVIGPMLPGSVAFSGPAFVVLVVLAAPPLLSGAYAGVGSVDPRARDAARGLGMSGREVLWRVEAPCALPLLWSGLRSATLQVIATATIAATVGTGGLGRFLIDGQAARNYGEMAGGAVLVAILAMLTDVLLGRIGRLVIPAGLEAR